MPSRRVLGSVVHDLHGTFTRRHSDHRRDGLFGQRPAGLGRWAVDLRGAPPAGKTPLDAAGRIATRRLLDQPSEAGLDLSVVRTAPPSCRREGPAVGCQGGHEARGHRVVVPARIAVDTGRRIGDGRSVFVAPHDPARKPHQSPIDSRR